MFFSYQGRVRKGFVYLNSSACPEMPAYFSAQFQCARPPHIIGLHNPNQIKARADIPWKQRPNHELVDWERFWIMWVSRGHFRINAYQCRCTACSESQPVRSAWFLLERGLCNLQREKAGYFPSVEECVHLWFVVFVMVSMRYHLCPCRERCTPFTFLVDSSKK